VPIGGVRLREAIAEHPGERRAEGEHTGRVRRHARDGRFRERGEGGDPAIALDARLERREQLRLGEREIEGTREGRFGVGRRPQIGAAHLQGGE